MPAVLSTVSCPGVVPSGDPIELTFFPGPAHHRPEFHRTVALRAGQRGDSVAITIDQSFDDLLLKRLSGVHNVMLNPELLADSGRVHKALSATGALSAHEPQGQALHMPSGFHQQCRRQGAVHATG